MYKGDIHLKYYSRQESGENQVGFEYSEAGFKAAVAFYNLLTKERMAVLSDLPQFDTGYDKSAIQSQRIWVGFVAHDDESGILALAFLKDNASLVKELLDF